MAVSQTNGRMQQASGVAASTLFKIMTDGNASDSVRVRAADSVLDRANQAIRQGGCPSPDRCFGAGGEFDGAAGAYGTIVAPRAGGRQ